MKRAKIMLLAIAVVASIGGALAFKAQKFAKWAVYCATFRSGSSGPLTCLSSNYTFDDDIINPLVTNTKPCEVWHKAVFGNLAATTTSYYTTTSCPTPFQSTVYSTIDQ